MTETSADRPALRRPALGGLGAVVSLGVVALALIVVSLSPSPVSKWAWGGAGAGGLVVRAERSGGALSGAGRLSWLCDGDGECETETESETL